MVNFYNDGKYVGWHTDEDRLFGTLDEETEILSLSFGPDGVFL